MFRLITLTLKGVFRALGALLLITSILVVGAWLKSEWKQLDEIKQEIATKEQLKVSLNAEVESIQTAIDSKDAEWRQRIQKTVDNLQAQANDIEKRLEKAQPGLTTVDDKRAFLETLARNARRAADDAKANWESLERKTAWWDKYLSPETLIELELAKTRYLALDDAASAAEAGRDQVAEIARNLSVQPLLERKKEISQQISDWKISESPEIHALRTDLERKQYEIQSIETLIESQRERVVKDPKERLLAAIRAKLPVAAMILIGAMLVPFFMKIVFYFALAPAASRLPPIRIIPDPHAPPIPEPSPSAVSIAIDVGPEDELLVRPEFLQSSSLPARKHTKWLLNPAIPFASIASGMYALTSIRPEGTTPTRVLVSSQKDPHGEIGVIEVPAGAAMVLQPRSLAGVVKAAGSAVDISRHWRPGSLHAWLTLQLRYLVFHGPCRLILKGCRGVRSEEPDPNQPRLINQIATLGFSANLDYKTTRCETFVPYLRGQEELFNDLFAGGPGRFIYEEMPAVRGKTGIISRGLEGIVDAVLKVFGI